MDTRERLTPKSPLFWLSALLGAGILPDWLAWDTFRESNGVASLEELRLRLSTIQEVACKTDRLDNHRRRSRRTHRCRRSSCRCNWARNRFGTSVLLGRRSGSPLATDLERFEYRGPRIKHVEHLHVI